MSRHQKTKILTILGVVDLACFALGGMGYGEIWSGVGVFGLLLFLAFFELL